MSPMCWRRGFEFVISSPWLFQRVFFFPAGSMILFAQWEESGLLAQSCQALGWRWSQFGASQRFRISDKMGAHPSRQPTNVVVPQELSMGSALNKGFIYDPSGHDLYPLPSHMFWAYSYIIQAGTFCSEQDLFLSKIVIWLHRVLVVACGIFDLLAAWEIFSFGMQTLSCCM